MIIDMITWRNPTIWDMQWVQDVEIADGHPGAPHWIFLDITKHFFVFF